MSYTHCGWPCCNNRTIPVFRREIATCGERRMAGKHSLWWEYGALYRASTIISKNTISNCGCIIKARHSKALISSPLRGYLWLFGIWGLYTSREACCDKKKKKKKVSQNTPEHHLKLEQCRSAFCLFRFRKKKLFRLA